MVDTTAHNVHIPDGPLIEDNQQKGQILPRCQNWKCTGSYRDIWMRAFFDCRTSLEGLRKLGGEGLTSFTCAHPLINDVHIFRRELHGLTVRINRPVHTWKALIPGAISCFAPNNRHQVVDRGLHLRTICLLALPR